MSRFALKYFWGRTRDRKRGKQQTLEWWGLSRAPCVPMARPREGKQQDEELKAVFNYIESLRAGWTHLCVLLSYGVYVHSCLRAG